MRFAIGFIAGVLLCLPLVAEEKLLGEWKQFSRSNQSRKMLQWLRCQAKERFSPNKCRELQVPLPAFYGKLGLFVTIQEKYRVRGCFGAFFHKTDKPYQVLREYLHGALREDLRHPPFDISRLPEAKIIITVAAQPHSIRNLEDIYPSREGVVLTSTAGRHFIYVPAEIRNTNSLKTIVRKYRILDIKTFKAVSIQ
ncbi:MAG: AMMECR1 domain-containing protein [Spirochaetota bacterium]